MRRRDLLPGRSEVLTAVSQTPMMLFWCVTDDHEEDWFVVALSAVMAARFHEREEGYNPGNARCRLVCRLPRGIVATVGWPDDATIAACGGRFLRTESPRVVEIAHRVYTEGMLEASLAQACDDMLEARGHGRPNRTRRQGDWS